MNSTNAQQRLSDGQKLQIINDDPRTRNKFHQLTRAERWQILAAMDVTGGDRNWILAEIEDVLSAATAEVV
jgi:hypothetical protein